MNCSFRIKSNSKEYIFDYRKDTSKSNTISQQTFLHAKAHDLFAKLFSSSLI